MPQVEIILKQTLLKSLVLITLYVERVLKLVYMQDSP